MASKKRKLSTGTPGQATITQYVTQPRASADPADLLAAATPHWQQIVGNMLGMVEQQRVFSHKYQKKYSGKLSGLLLKQDGSLLGSRLMADGKTPVSMPMDLKVAREELSGSAATAATVAGGNQYKSFMAYVRACQEADGALQTCNKEMSAVSAGW